jgi:hypothetical protein
MPSRPLRIVANRYDEKAVIVSADHDCVLVAIASLRLDHPPVRYII